MDQVVIAFILILSIIGFLISQFARGKFANLYSGTAFAVIFSLLILGSTIHLGYVSNLKNTIQIQEIAILATLITFILLIIFHQIRYKHKFHRLLIAIITGGAILFLLGIFVMMFTVCAHGDCF